MKKRFSVIFSILLVFSLTLTTVFAQEAQVTTTVESEQYELTFEVLKEDADEVSTAGRYMNNPAIITIEDGKTFATITLNSSQYWQSLQTQTEQPGTFEDDNFVVAEIVSEDEEANERDVKFEVSDLTQLLNVKAHIIVTGIPGMGTYDSVYNLRIKFNDAEVEEEPVIEEETEEEQTSEEEASEEEGIANGEYSIDLSFLHEEEDQPSQMGRYIETPAKFTVNDSTYTLTLNLLSNEQITNIKIEQNDTFIEGTVVEVDEEADTRLVSFELTDLSSILNAKVQVYVASANYSSERGFRIVLEHEIIDALTASEDSVKTFDDITTSWAKSYIEALATDNVIKGKSEDRFAPNDNITRAEFAVIIARALDLPQTAYEGTFSDVTESLDWAVLEIEAANRADIVFGVSEGTFKPNDPITREQMVTMIIRAIEYKDASILEDVESELSFIDEASIQNYAKQHVNAAVGLNIIDGIEVNGGFKFAPADQASRAQAAKVVYQLLETISE